MRTMIAAAMAVLLLIPRIAGAEPRIDDVTFESHGVTLSGSIVLPDGSPIHAAVVFIH